MIKIDSWAAIQQGNIQKLKNILITNGLQHDWDRMVVTTSYRRHRSGAEDEGGLFFSFYRYHSGCRSILHFDGNRFRRIPRSSDQPHRRRRRGCQGIRFDTLPFRPLERGHSGFSGGSGQHRFTDEQGGWFCGFRPMGFQARKVEGWCAGSHHSARYSDIHR